MDGNVPAVAVDIGGTNTRFALISHGGRILSGIRRPTRRGGFESFSAALRGGLAELFSGEPRCANACGIGIGLKGFVDYERQLVVSSSLIQEPGPHDLAKDIRREFEMPVTLDNDVHDVHAAAAAELRFGAGTDEKHFAYVNLGTGMSVGFVYGGVLIRGRDNHAGEAGLALMHRNGGVFRAEDVISGAGINAELRRLCREFPASGLARRVESGAWITSEEAFRSRDEGDPLAAAVTDGFEDVLAVTLYNLEMTLNPGLYVFGGGVVGDGRVLERARRRLLEYSARQNTLFAGRLEISRLGAGDAGLLGAACLVWERAAGEKFIKE